MQKLKKKLIMQAMVKHGKITPCRKWKNYKKCFTIVQNSLLFWYNDYAGSTHIEKIVIPSKYRKGKENA